MYGAAWTPTVRVIVDEHERRTLLADVARTRGRTDVETMVRHSPLIEGALDDPVAP